jgi:hypothetical protein
MFARKYAVKFLFAFCPVSLVASIVLFFVVGVHYWPVYVLSALGFATFLVGRRLRRGGDEAAE